MSIFNSFNGDSLVRRNTANFEIKYVFYFKFWWEQSIVFTCNVLGISRSVWYFKLVDRASSSLRIGQTTKITTGETVQLVTRKVFCRNKSSRNVSDFAKRSPFCDPCYATDCVISYVPYLYSYSFFSFYKSLRLAIFIC